VPPRWQGTYGFVGFQHQRDADDALRALDRYELHGERLRVERTKDSMRAVTSARGDSFNANERCYNCGQYGHWYEAAARRRAVGSSTSVLTDGAPWSAGACCAG